MRIGINLLPFRRRLTGTGVYAFNIINEVCLLDEKNVYYLFTNKESDGVFNYDLKNIRKVLLPFKAKNTVIRIFWEQFILPFILSKYKIDILFSPSVVSPVFSNCKNVVCIHDLIPFHIENKYTRLRSFYVKKMTKISSRKANFVLTVSKNSKKELIKYCNIPEKKINVTYNGINKKILNPDFAEWNEFRKKINLFDNYILFVGTLEPGKNLKTLIRAYKLLLEKYNIDCKLVIAGGRGWLYDEIFLEVENLHLEKKVIFTGYVPDGILGALYKNAELLVLISLYEGFGIPALEAMYFGVPVIVSNRSSLPEVVGNAGLVVDPNREDEIANAIYEVLTDSVLKTNLIKKGYSQIKKFSWRISAKVAIKTFNEV